MIHIVQSPAFYVSPHSIYPSRPWIAQVSDTSTGFSIYCTSNHDSTGACNRVDNDLPIDCVVVPGGVISCKQKGQPPIQCVLYSAPLDTQAYFYCTRRTDPGIRENPINPSRFSSPSKSPLNEIEQPLNPLPGTIDNAPAPPNQLPNPFRNVL